MNNIDALNSESGGVRTIHDARFTDKPNNAQRHACRAEAVSGHVLGAALC